MHRKHLIALYRLLSSTVTDGLLEYRSDIPLNVSYFEISIPHQLSVAKRKRASSHKIHGANGAFQSNESNRLSLRRFVSSSTIGYDCSAKKSSSSVSCYSLSLCYSDIPLLFFLMKCFGSCIIFGDEDCSAGPQEEIPVYG
ncbi:hypothetical protein ACHWQZ_G017114 [Mnemiopsis leidyi]